MIFFSSLWDGMFVITANSVAELVIDYHQCKRSTLRRNLNNIYLIDFMHRLSRHGLTSCLGRDQPSLVSLANCPMSWGSTHIAYKWLKKGPNTFIPADNTGPFFSTGSAEHLRISWCDDTSDKLGPCPTPLRFSKVVAILLLFGLG